MRALVYGLAITGASTVRALQAHAYSVVVADDSIDPAKQDLAASLGVELLPRPIDPDAFTRQFDLVSPSPGVPETHPVVIAARNGGIKLWSEIELAYRWEQERPGGPRPVLAITGTDGKTSTTLLTRDILRAAGLRAEALGNTDVPFVDALDEWQGSALDVFVVECTSFRLAWTEQFRADAAVWLNLASDHLNWHTSMASYVAAKARLFDLQRPTDVAIAFSADPVVMKHLDAAPGRRVTFGRTGADYRLEGTTLMSPFGPIGDISVMRRSLPHDITNALAASALVLETGLATPEAIVAALRTFASPPHRIEPLGECGGISWFNDSKATTPHAASTAIQSFDSLVLIAGGSHKGLDLSPMGAESHRIRGVVATGDAAPDIHKVFDGLTTVVDATSMSEAVQFAAELAKPGDAVVLSPGCASFDWYNGYPERGDDFRRLVAEHIAKTNSQSKPVKRPHDIAREVAS